MSLTKWQSIGFFLVLLPLGCKSVKEVSFRETVDTTSKSIAFQKKQTYSLEELGVYASNDFDGARLNGFEKLNDSTATVIITPENEPINNSAYYAFNIWADTKKPFYIKFDYPKLYRHRYIPKLKKEDEWHIMKKECIFINKDSVVTIKLDLNSKPLTVAAQELQTYNDVKQWYIGLLKGKENYATLEYFGQTPLGRDLPVINIGVGSPKGKDVVVLLTRQHPPEVTGYYAYQHFLSTILNGSELSTAFLKKYQVLAFPILNPDGVDLGHWRHNTGGVDTNRDWAVYNQPEIKQVVKYITKELNKNDSKIVLGLDFHSTYHDVFYTNKIREGTTMPNFIEDWFAALEANIPNYKVNEAAGNSTKPVSKGWFLYGHNAVGITYEIGDATPKERIKVIGTTTAKEMMKILI
jgi:hypothetical protein